MMISLAYPNFFMYFCPQMYCFMATYLIGSVRNFLIGRLCAD